MTQQDPFAQTRWGSEEAMCSAVARLAQELSSAEGLRFTQAIVMAGLDPRRDLRFGDWSGLCLDGEDLRGFDFTGADLRGSTFVNALIEGANFQQAELDQDALGRASDGPLSRRAPALTIVETKAARPPAHKKSPLTKVAKEGDLISSPFDLTGPLGAEIEGAVSVVRPHRVQAAAYWFQEHFPGEVFYAVKANPERWVIDALWSSGVRSFDVASVGEIERVLGWYPSAYIAFMHPVKPRRAIQRAYFDFRVRTFALDSLDELEKILKETGGARDLRLFVRLAAPGDGAAYPLTRKFGATPEEAPELLRRARAATQRELGVAFHVGSQCMRPDSYSHCMSAVNKAVVSAGVLVDVVNVGGGFPAIYPGMNPPPMIKFIDDIKAGFQEMFVAQNCRLWAEPGRALVAEAGSTVLHVELRKGDALYVNDGAFGSLFDATHLNWPFPMRLLRQEPSIAKNASFRLYGPTCDSMDAAAGPFTLPADIREGDLIEVGMLGAYATTMQTAFCGIGAPMQLVSADAPWPTMFASEGNRSEPPRMAEPPPPLRIVQRG